MGKTGDRSKQRGAAASQRQELSSRNDRTQREAPAPGQAASARRQAPDRDEVDALVREYRRAKAAEARRARRKTGQGSAASPDGGNGGSAALRDRLIAQHLYLVQTAARKFAGLGESHEDLLQEGAMGLINAVDLYDPDRGVQFSTYATHLVEGQIRHYLRDRGKLIKQPAWVQELTAKITRASDALTQQLNRPPSDQEIADMIGTTAANVRRMLEARERSKVASLDAARGEDDEQGPALDPEKLLVSGADSGSAFQVEDRIFLQEAMSRLKELERKVVHSFYYLDLNQTEIARRLGISVNYASYLLRGGVAQLRKAFEAEARQARPLQAASADGPPTSQSPDRASAGSPGGDSDPYSLSSRPSPIDPITRLATESYLMERLQQEVARASRYPQQFSLLLVEPDVPGCASGCVAGQEPASAGPLPAASETKQVRSLDENALVGLARLLRTNCRSIDLVARMSGSRFALLLPHTGREASVLADRICRMVESRKGENRRPEGEAPQPGTDRGDLDSTTPGFFTVSIGFAVFSTDGRTAAELLAGAQRALAQAQGEGGNRALRAEPVGKPRRSQ